MIEIDATAFERLANKLRAGVVDDELARTAQQTIPAVAEAQLRAVKAAARRHRKTGKLEAAITLERRGSGLATTVELHAGDVAAIIVGGSRPHDIRPAAGHALRLVGGSVTGFAAGVHHPGTSPDPFIARGVAAASGETASIIDAGAARLGNRLAARLEEG